MGNWISNLVDAVKNVANTQTMVLANTGVATSYNTTGLYIPRVKSTVGDEVGYLVDVISAPTQPAEIKAVYNVARHPVRTVRKTKQLIRDNYDDRILAIKDFNKSLHNKSHKRSGDEAINIFERNRGNIIATGKDDLRMYFQFDGSDDFITSSALGNLIPADGYTRGIHLSTKNVVDTDPDLYLPFITNTPNGNITYSIHIPELTKHGLIKAYKAFQEYIPKHSYIGEFNYLPLGLLAINTYNKTGSKLKAYLTILRNRSVPLNIPELEDIGMYSTDAYKAILKLGKLPGYELRYMKLPLSRFNNDGKNYKRALYFQDKLDSPKDRNLFIDSVNNLIEESGNTKARRVTVDNNGNVKIPYPYLFVK